MSARARALALLLLGVCGCVRSYGKVEEGWSPTIPGTRFKSLAVVASSDDRTDLQIALRVRRALEKQGLTVVRRSGRWESETAALNEICPAGPPAAAPPADSTAGAVDGVLLVSWDRLSLRECPTHQLAYEVKGSYTGVDHMMQRLMRYLRRGAGS